MAKVHEKKENIYEDNGKKQKRYIKIYSILIIIAILFLSVAYAQISDVKLEVTGTLEAPIQTGIFISNVTRLDSSSGVVSDEIKYYKGTTLSTMVELNDPMGAGLVYRISLYNNSSNDYYFSGVSYDTAAYDNLYIDFDIVRTRTIFN